MNKRGFTLIEVMAVIIIIMLLGGIVIVTVNSARKNARDAQRMTDLHRLQAALTAYYVENGSFPSQFPYASSEPGDQATYSANYIPGLVPNYIATLPRDPKGGPSAMCGGNWKSAYLYISEGTMYKVISHCAVESTVTSTHPLYDPLRPGQAFMVCSGVTACQTW